MLVLVFTLLTAIVFAHAQNAVVTIEEVNTVGADNYKFRYRASDGTEREEEGKFVGDVWTVTGMFTWIGSDGVIYSTRFISDDKGYRIFPEFPAEGVRPSYPTPVIPQRPAFSPGGATIASILGIG